MLASLQTLCTINWIFILPIILCMNYFSNFIFFLLHNLLLFQQYKCSITFLQADRVQKYLRILKALPSHYYLKARVLTLKDVQKETILWKKMKNCRLLSQALILQWRKYPHSIQASLKRIFSFYTEIKSKAFRSEAIGEKS